MRKSLFILIVVHWLILATLCLECPTHQEQFDQGLRSLHSFWYSQANEIFTNITLLPKAHCPLAYWGIAMCHWYPLWVKPSPKHVQVAKQNLEQALEQELPFKEKELVQTFYQFLVSNLSTEEYQIGMTNMMYEYPNDVDLLAFWALSNLAVLKALGPSDKECEIRNRTGMILKEALVKNPKHVGLLHYLIHAYDHPVLSKQSLEEADLYPKVAPDIPHALHMPSHTYQHLGYWSKSVTANVHSISSVYPNTNYPGQLHSLGFLVNALLQQGQVSKVWELVEHVQQRHIEFGTLGVSEAFDMVSIPMKYALNTKNWTMAAQLDLLPKSANWNMHPWTSTYKYFSRMVGNYFLGQMDLVLMNHKFLLRSHDDSKLSPSWNYVPMDLRMEIDKMIDICSELVAEVENRKTLDGFIHSSEFMIIPLSELVADVLFSRNKFVEAGLVYKQTLSLYPNRMNSVNGLSKTLPWWFRKPLAQKLVSLCNSDHTYICPVEFCGTNGTKYSCTERKELVDARRYLKQLKFVGVMSGIFVVSNIVVCVFICLLRMSINKKNMEYTPI